MKGVLNNFSTPDFYFFLFTVLDGVDKYSSKVIDGAVGGVGLPALAMAASTDSWSSSADRGLELLACEPLCSAREPEPEPEGAISRRFLFPLEPPDTLPPLELRISKPALLPPKLI